MRSSGGRPSQQGWAGAGRVAWSITRDDRDAHSRSSGPVDRDHAGWRTAAFGRNGQDRVGAGESPGRARPRRRGWTRSGEEVEASTQAEEQSSVPGPWPRTPFGSSRRRRRASRRGGGGRVTTPGGPRAAGRTPASARRTDGDVNAWIASSARPARFSRSRRSVGACCRRTRWPPSGREGAAAPPAGRGAPGPGGRSRARNQAQVPTSQDKVDTLGAQGPAGVLLLVDRGEVGGPAATVAQRT